MYCVLVSTVIWLETKFRTNPSAMLLPYVFCFCNRVSIPTGGQKSKDITQNIFGQKIFKMVEFAACDNDNVACLLGSHSIRKYTATHGQRCGCNKDDKDIRGRWKSKGRVSDVYDDVEFQYPDAKVAEKLSVGGACFYLFPNEDARVDNVVNKTVGEQIEMLKTFILAQVVPNFQKRLPELACALVLGKPLLWFICCNDVVSNNFPPCNSRIMSRMS
jgi:hypothetical protein